MFRRRRGMARMFAPRPAVRRPGLAAAAQQALVRANRLMEVGDFVNAAQLYEQLGRGAHDFGRPRQSAHLYLQAARALTLAGKTQPGLLLLEQGLSLFAGIGAWVAFQRIGERAVVELTQAGQSQAALELARWLEGQRKAHPEAALPPQPAAEPGGLGLAEPGRLSAVEARPSLPPKCPYCGATIRADEVEWLDETSAECAYCGSAVQAVS